METVKDYLDKLEIKNSILAKQLKETYINRVVYFKEDRVVYFYLTSKSIIDFINKNSTDFSISKYFPSFFYLCTRSAVRGLRPLEKGIRSKAVTVPAAVGSIQRMRRGPPHYAIVLRGEKARIPERVSRPATEKSNRTLGVKRP